MKLVAIGAVHNEVDILESTVRHLFAQGIDRMMLTDHRSTDGTAELLDKLAHRYPIDLRRDTGRYFEQKRIINGMAEKAWLDGADWVLPFDADEFWVPVNRTSLRKVIADVAPKYTALIAKVFWHKDRQHRQKSPRPLPKVVIRSTAGRIFCTGNHETDPVTPRDLAAHGIVEVREIPFRGLEHYIRKLRTRGDMMRPHADPNEHVEYREAMALSDDELRKRWRALQLSPVVNDPIP
jgi:hypothetical protein